MRGREIFQLTKDEKERWQLDTTRKFLCAAELRGNALKSETPDFVIETYSGAVDVEVTEAICRKEAAANADLSRAAQQVSDGDWVDLPSGAWVADDGETLMAFAGAFRKDPEGRSLVKSGYGDTSNPEAARELLDEAFRKKSQPNYVDRWPANFVSRFLIVYLNASSMLYSPSLKELFNGWTPTIAFYDAVFVLRGNGNEVVRYTPATGQLIAESGES